MEKIVEKNVEREKSQSLLKKRKAVLITPEMQVLLGMQINLIPEKRYEPGPIINGIYPFDAKMAKNILVGRTSTVTAKKRVANEMMAQEVLKDYDVVLVVDEPEKQVVIKTGKEEIKSLLAKFKLVKRYIPKHELIGLKIPLYKYKHGLQEIVKEKNSYIALIPKQK